MALKKKVIENNELDLIEIISLIFKNKFKIFFITVLLLIVVFFIQIKREHVVQISTEIVPISIFDETKYNTYNSLLVDAEVRAYKSLLNEIDKNNSLLLDAEVRAYKSLLNEIDKNFLLKLFVDRLKDQEILREEIKKSNLILKENYSNNKSYEEAVIKKAASIKISPIKDKYWKIQYEIKDKSKIDTWENLIKNIEIHINNQIKIFIKNIFDDFILKKEKEKNFLIEDIDIAMENEMKIYELRISKRIAFLMEQAMIARQLDLKKTNLTEVQIVGSEKGLINNFGGGDVPYYMRGYDVIEKEIDLINERSDKTLFVDKLTNLSNEKLKIKTNKTIERLKKEFSETPVFNHDFFAAQIKFESTNYEYLNKKLSSQMILIFTFLFGIILGIFYVLIENSIKNNR